MKRLLALMISLSACQQPATVGSDNSTGNSIAAVSHVSVGLTLEQVQQAIAQSGANWVASETRVAKLPADQRKALLGAPLRQDFDVNARIREEADASLPAQFDWRNNNGQNFISPVLDQGQCGSCVAFAAIGTFESVLNIAANDPSSPFELSPQQLFACGGAACDWGWDGDSAADQLVSEGVVDSVCLPYTSGAAGADVSCDAQCSDHASRTIKARSYSKPTSGGTNINKVKQALMIGPIMTSMTVYEDFMYYTSGVYKHVTGGVAGGHEISIVGWNDADQAWIVRNSWNTDWGMNGFFEIAYSDVSGVGADTVQLVANTPGPYVSFKGLRDGDLLSGVQNYSVDAQQLDATTVGYTFTKSGSAAMHGQGSSIDTTTIADGVYTLQPAAGGVNGAPHIVSVLNGPLTGAVAFQGLSEGSTVKGTVTLNFTATSSPVPLQQLRLLLVDSTGATLIDRIIAAPAASDSIGWDTTRRPNGSYTISIGGSAGTHQLPNDVRHITIKN